MIRFTVDGEKYEYDERKLLNVEAIALQKVTGMRIKEFGQALNDGDAVAMNALVWLAMRRAGHEVKYSELEFDLNEVVESMEQDEPDAQSLGQEGEPDPTTPLDEPRSSGESRS